MQKEVWGTVVSASKQWWLKVRKSPLQGLGSDSAAFPYILKVEYQVDGVTYTKRKWIGAGKPVPNPGSRVKVLYPEEAPAKASVQC